MSKESTVVTFQTIGDTVCTELGGYVQAVNDPPDRCEQKDCRHLRSTLAVEEGWPLWESPYNCPFGKFPHNCAEYHEMVGRHYLRGELV